MKKLQEHLHRFLENLKKDNSMPKFSELRFFTSTDTTLGEHNIHHISKDKIYTKEEYITQFEKILGVGYPWINMNCAGIKDELLYIFIELPKTVPKEKYDRTSVNISGSFFDYSTNKAIWNLDHYFNIDA